MSYIGKAPGFGIRNRYYYTATASQTLFDGADDNGQTLAYADSKYLDVFLNGVSLVAGTDYTAATGTSVSLTTGAAADDIIEIVAYDIFSVADTVSAANGGTFAGVVAFSDDVNVDSGTLFVDASADAVGIGTSSPSHPLHVLATAAGQTTVKFESNQAGAMNVALDVDTDRDCFLQFQEAGTTRWDILMNGSIGTNPLKIRDDGGTTQGEFDQSGNFKFNSGYGSAATAYGCRAWVKTDDNSNTSVDGSANISSVTDGGTGIATFNFSTSMPDANYCVTTAGSQNVGTYVRHAFVRTPLSTTSFTVDTDALNGYYDGARIMAAVFR